MKALSTLKSFFGVARKVAVPVGAVGLRAELDRLYAHSCESCNELITLADDDLNIMMEALIADIWRRGLKDGWSRKAALRMAEELMKGVFEGYGLDITAAAGTDYAMLTALESNVYQFSAAKSYQMSADISKLLTNEEAVRSFESFRAAASKEVEQFVGSWIKSEYNQAIATAQASSNWVQIQANKTVLPNLTYKAVMDARTRDEHRKMHDITRPADDAFWKTYYPPNDWGCRCNAISTSLQAVTSDNAIALKGLEPPKDGFNVNLAAEGKIFPKEHPYYKNLPASVLEEIKNLQPKRDA